MAYSDKYDFGLFTSGPYGNYTHGSTAPKITEPEPEPERIPRRVPKKIPEPKRPIPKRSPVPCTKPKKEPKIIQLPVQRTKRNPLRLILNSVAFLLIFGIALLAVDRNAELTELTDQIEQTQKLLQEAQATEVQLNMLMDSKTNQLDLERYAKTQLGMQPIQKNQVTYVNALTEDKGVIHAPVDEPGILETIKTKFKELLDLFG